MWCVVTPYSTRGGVGRGEGWGTSTRPFVSLRKTGFLGMRGHLWMNIWICLYTCLFPPPSWNFLQVYICCKIYRSLFLILFLFAYILVFLYDLRSIFLTLSYSSKINGYLCHQRVSPPLKKKPWYVIRGQCCPSIWVWQPSADSNGSLAPFLFEFKLSG